MPRIELYYEEDNCKYCEWISSTWQFVKYCMLITYFEDASYKCCIKAHWS